MPFRIVTQDEQNLTVRGDFGSPGTPNRNWSDQLDGKAVPRGTVGRAGYRGDSPHDSAGWWSRCDSM